MSRKKIIIAGAGIAGLVSARLLLKAGHDVSIVEARDRTGGRMLTLQKDDFFVEAGPEFIHGRLKATIALLKTYGIGFAETTGLSYQRGEKGLQTGEDNPDGWDRMLEEMEALEPEISLTNFLHNRFGEPKYTELRTRAIGFASGFDLADPQKVSAHSLAREWQTEEGPQYRLLNGYGSLIRSLESEVRSLGGEIHFNTVLEAVEWEQGSARFVSGNAPVNSGDLAVFTLPVAVVHCHPRPAQLLPGLPEKVLAAGNIGVGTVIKIVTEWKEPFWEALAPEALFFFGGGPIPTWWTKRPVKGNQLTGWLGGPEARKYSGLPAEQLLAMGLDSLSLLFSISGTRLKELLRIHYVFDWTADPLSRGAYTYTLASAPGAREIWAASVADTLYFAGEACYTGSMVGTVEAAVLSAEHAMAGLLEKHAGR